MSEAEARELELETDLIGGLTAGIVDVGSSGHDSLPFGLGRSSMHSIIHLAALTPLGCCITSLADADLLLLLCTAPGVVPVAHRVAGVALVSPVPLLFPPADFLKNLRELKSFLACTGVDISL